jgi:hypothetical protein
MMAGDEQYKEFEREVVLCIRMDRQIALTHSILSINEIRQALIYI